MSFHQLQILPPSNPLIPSYVNSSCLKTFQYTLPSAHLYVFPSLDSRTTKYPLRPNRTFDRMQHYLPLPYLKIIKRVPRLPIMSNPRLQTEEQNCYAYSISGIITSHRMRNTASIFAAELMTIFSCLSHLTHCPPTVNSSSLQTLFLPSMHSWTPPP